MVKRTKKASLGSISEKAKNNSQIAFLARNRKSFSPFILKVLLGAYHTRFEHSRPLTLKQIQQLLLIVTTAKWSCATIGRGLAKAFDGKDSKGMAAYRQIFADSPRKGMATEGRDGLRIVDAVSDSETDPSAGLDSAD